MPVLLWDIDFKLKYIFGPVISRRLGISLGLDIVPYKTCTFDCIYCESGTTTEKTIGRKPYIDSKEILNELGDYLKESPNLDYITITGSGEPTLNSEIGLLINEIKKISKVPVAVLTNSSLLYLPEVRKELLSADLVIPSLDAAGQGSFLKISRPPQELDLKKIIEGLILFGKEFKGKIWLEILFVKNINDTEEEVEGLIKIIKEVNPDKVQLNTIDRPPADKSALRVSNKDLEDICRKFKNNNLPAQIISSAGVRADIQISEHADLKEKIINLIKRRPETAGHIADTFGAQINNINKILKDLEEQNIVTITYPDNKNEPYYCIKS